MIVEVAAAVIQRADGAFLLTRRPAGKVYAGYWEFPGGKIEAGEPAADALSRELHEELGIGVRRAYPWLTRVFAYAHALVRLHFFRVLEWSGEPHPREAQQVHWQRSDAPLAEPMLPANAPVLASLALPDRYAITAAATLGVETQLARLEAALGAGLRLIQVRDRALDAVQRRRFAQAVVTMARRARARVLVSDDAALAAAIGADGVHLPAATLMGLTARPEFALVGALCHTAPELEQAARLGLDFALLGPVRPSPTHPGAPGIGWEAFARIARGASLPVYAIGGLRAEDREAAWQAGAHGVAMIRDAWREAATRSQVDSSRESGSSAPRVSGTR